MLCKSPYMIGPLPCACMRCMPCRINKKRQWTFRLELESRKHKKACVATLTYNNFHLPEGGTLVPSHPQLWLKRLRKALAPQKIRYFLVGEYGETTRRPHYHCLLFGVGADLCGDLSGRDGLVKKTWKYGNILVDKITPESIAYVAGYVTKKLTDDDRKQNGLEREFTRMSLRPYGIGAGAIKDVAKALNTPFGLESINASGDVPFALRTGSKTVSIGRYLRGLLREKFTGSRDLPQARKTQYWQEMWALRKTAQTDSSRKASSYKQYLVDKDSQKIINLEARSKIFVGKHKF